MTVREIVAGALLESFSMRQSAAMKVNSLLLLRLRPCAVLAGLNPVGSTR
jgi:hypothetical protein